MLSFDRRGFLFTLSCFAALGACGYTPALTSASPSAALYNNVQIASPGNAQSFALVSRLEDRLGRGAPGRWVLNYSISVSSERTGIATDESTTRNNLLGAVQFSLTDRQSEQIALTGTVSSFTGYDATASTLATESARRDATERVMVLLADQIVTRLIALAPQ